MGDGSCARRGQLNKPLTHAGCTQTTDSDADMEELTGQLPPAKADGL
jgi:hypothetical protein